MRGKDRGEPQLRRPGATLSLPTWNGGAGSPHQLGATYVMVNIPDYTLKVTHLEKTVWSTWIVVGKPGKFATPLLADTMKYITFNLNRERAAFDHSQRIPVAL